MAVCAIGGVLWHLRSVDRSPTLVVASSIDRGDTIRLDDLRRVNVAADGPVHLITPSEADRVVGRTAAVDLPTGTMLSESMLTDVGTVGKDDGLVGLALEPGQYPSTKLAPGDSVEVVAKGDEAAVAHAEVFSVEGLAGAERKLVTLRTTKEAADRVAAADDRTMRLVLVGS